METFLDGLALDILPWYGSQLIASKEIYFLSSIAQ